VRGPMFPLGRWLLPAFAAGSLLAVPAAAAPQEGGEGLYSTPEAVARLFFAAFERQDFTTLQALFTPAAVVFRVRVGGADGAAAEQLSVAGWVAAAAADLAGVEGLTVELQEVRSLAFDGGASVSVRFRASGRAGDRAFHNAGVDTFSLVPVKGSWRIVLYSSFEAGPPQPQASPGS
jgi:SnoaL-like domain